MEMGGWMGVSRSLPRPPGLSLAFLPGEGTHAGVPAGLGTEEALPAYRVPPRFRRG